MPKTEADEKKLAGKGAEAFGGGQGRKVGSTCLRSNESQIGSADATEFLRLPP